VLVANLRRKLQHTFIGREETHEALFLDNFYCAFPGGASPAAYEPYMRYWNERPDTTLLSRMLYADQKTYLVELLMKQDQMSMAASLESRVPFLDHTFVEFAATIPDHLKIRGDGEQKYILKKAVEDLLPHEIVYRKKMGFPTPMRQWLMSPEAKPLFDAIRDRKGFLAQYVDLDQMEPLFERHLANHEDATDRIWRLLGLQIWGDIFITGKRDRWWKPDPTRTPAASTVR
jgi:asparagine synthase (glutamine-hydrolysing)